MTRAILIVLDSVGCGGAPDAAYYGDEGADTLGHIAAFCARGSADNARRSGVLHLPRLDSFGLGLACEASTGVLPPGFSHVVRKDAFFGCASEIAQGKDTPSGHWEIAGAPFVGALGHFPRTIPCFPQELISALVQEAALPGVLGQKHAAGAPILQELGEAHIASGKPIIYTSVDSVFQIAAHEKSFGLERLYETCRIARRICDRWAVGRVIARPFLGRTAQDFTRTPNRKDFPIPAPASNLLDRANESGRDIACLGKIGDTFGHRATGREIQARDNDGMIDALLTTLGTLGDGGLVFANLVDFDTDFGHRRDIAGYACALEAFDVRLAQIEQAMAPGDLLILTADHGNDPTWPGTDHTRENAPIVGFVKSIGTRASALRGPLGRRASFADIGQTIACYLGLPPVAAGCSFIPNNASGEDMRIF